MTMNVEHEPNPMISEDVVLHPPRGDSDQWILQVGYRRYIRIRPGMARLVQLLDGTRSIEELAKTLGNGWTINNVELAIEKLSNMKLLNGHNRLVKNEIIRIEGLHRITLTVLRTPKLFNKLRPIARLLISKPCRITWYGVIIFGAVVFFANWVKVREAVSVPVPLTTYLTISLAFLGVMILHELSHGLVLTGLGGTPNEVGVMLFYFTPAFFCDVTDGWRLPKKEQRVAVVLAGILFQLAIAGIVSIVNLFDVSDDVSMALTIFASLNYISCCVNALPFVKLDGYLVMMTYLDKPFLREKAMSETKVWLSWAMFGGRFDRRRHMHIGTLILGLLSLGMPLYIVITVVMVISESIKGLGLLTSWFKLGVILAFLYYFGQGCYNLLRNAINTGASKLRISIVSLIAMGLLILAIVLVKVPANVQGGYINTKHGLHFVSLTPVNDSEAGSTVILTSRGMITSKIEGKATVVDCGSKATAPISAILPIDTSEVEIPTYDCLLGENSGDIQETGGATIQHKSLPLWKWAYYQLSFGIESNVEK